MAIARKVRETVTRSTTYRTLDQWKAVYLPALVESASKKKLEQDPAALAVELAKQAIDQFALR